MTEREELIATTDGAMTTFVAHPDEGGPFPVVLAYMDALGLRDELRGIGRRIADAGYFVVIPDLYHRFGSGITFDAWRLQDPASDEMQRMFGFIHQLDDGALMEDTRAILDRLENEPSARGGSKGCVGFCLGGRLVVRAMTTFPDVFAAGSALHPSFIVGEGLDSAHLRIGGMRGELYVGLGGADTFQPPEAFEPARAELERHGIRHVADVHEGADHGFMIPGAPAYHDEASEHAWERTLELFHRTLQEDSVDATTSPPESSAASVLDCPDGQLQVTELGGGRRRLTAVPRDNTVFIKVAEYETAYPVELVRLVLRVRGLRAVCDEIEREESPGYLQHVLYWTLHGHVDPSMFAGKRLLDFGCGAGASTMILARMLPETEIVGVDFDRPALELASARRDFYGYERVSFQTMEDPTTLPADLGEYDFVVFSAVFEHLLPAERATLIPALWSHLREGGVFFVGETPHRFTPVESHTTGGVPLINYLPPPAAAWAARRFSPRIGGDSSWDELLRAGIRGGTERMFLRFLRDAGHSDAELLRPAQQGLRDEFDLWYQISHVNELPGVKARLRSAFRWLRRLTGISFTPYLSFAVARRAKALARRESEV